MPASSGVSVRAGYENAIGEIRDPGATLPRMESADLAGQPGTVSLTIPAKPEFLALCRLVLAGLAQTKSIDAETLSDLELAVTEACTNAITHAYDEAGGTIVVRCLVGSDRVDVEIEDRGRGFDGAPGRPEETSESGRGLAVIQAVSDSVEVTRGPDGVGSRIRIRKLIG